jgi:flagellar biosynthesis protein FlhG
MLFVNDQAQKLRELAQNKMVDNDVIKPVQHRNRTGKAFKSIAITSGKGGVGKSNIALFLATTLAHDQKKVLLLDADLGLANVHILLGIAPVHTVTHFIDGHCSMNQIITETTAGFDIIPGASGIEKMANIDSVRLSRLQHGLYQLENNYDFLIVDTGAGIGSTVTKFASNTDFTLIIMTPEPTSLADAYAMVKVLHERNTPNIGIVVNMSSSDREGVETFDKLNALVLKFLKRPVAHYGTLPFFNEVGRYVKKQSCLLLEKNTTAFSRRILGIARRLYNINSLNQKGFFNRILSSS